MPEWIAPFEKMCIVSNASSIILPSVRGPPHRARKSCAICNRGSVAASRGSVAASGVVWPHPGKVVVWPRQG